MLTYLILNFINFSTQYVGPRTIKNLFKVIFISALLLWFLVPFFLSNARCSYIIHSPLVTTKQTAVSIQFVQIPEHISLDITLVNVKQFRTIREFPSAGWLTVGSAACLTFNAVFRPFISVKCGTTLCHLLIDDCSGFYFISSLKCLLLCVFYSVIGIIFKSRLWLLFVYS